MAASIKAGIRPRHNRMGNLLQLDVQLNLGVYVTGGVDYDPVKHGADPRTLVGWNIPPQGANTYLFDPTTKKIKAIVIATGAEVANSTDLSALTVYATFQFGP